MKTQKNKLVSAFEAENNNTETTNGAVAYKSTLNAVLDFFGQAGAMRTNTSEAATLFTKAMQENENLAIRALLHTRDVRGGKGERAVFYSCVKALANGNESYRKIAKSLIPLISEYGCYRDIMECYENTLLESEAISYIRENLVLDENKERPSLLAKWVPSENTSSKATRLRARKIRGEWKTSKEYRKLLSGLRDRISILENNLREKDYGSIDW